MPEEGFPLPGSSYDEIVKVIRAYNHFEGEVSLPEVSSVAGMHASNVSRNNGFLVNIGVIQGGKKKAMTEAGRALARALDHSIAEEITRNWQSIVSANDFLKRIIAAVKIRNGMEYSALQSHVAYTAGQPKSPTVMAGSGAVVDILKAANVLREEDGKLMATEYSIGVDSSGTISVVGEPTISKPGIYQGGLYHGVIDEEVSPQPQRQKAEPRAGVPVAIQIQIQCTPQDVESLGPKLRDLLKQLQELGEDGGE